MTRTLWLAVIAVFGWAAAGECLPGKEPAVVSPPGCRLELRFTSDVPDSYYVLSGPAQSYRRHRVNDDLRKALEGYVAGSSGAGETVGVHVHLKAVKTTFQQEGAVRPKRTGPFADNASAGPILLATAGSLNNSVIVPERVTKGVILVLDAEVFRSGREPRRFSWESSSTEVVPMERFDVFAYNYQDVIGAAIRNAVTDVDRLLRDALK